MCVCVCVRARAHTYEGVLKVFRAKTELIPNTHTYTHIHTCIYIYIYICVCVCVCVCVCTHIWRGAEGFSSQARIDWYVLHIDRRNKLFNGTSKLVSYLMSKKSVLNDSSDTIKHIVKGVHSFPKGINSKMNVIPQL